MKIKTTTVVKDGLVTYHFGLIEKHNIKNLIANNKRDLLSNYLQTVFELTTDKAEELSAFLFNNFHEFK